jgi:hypothetical protein
MPIEVWKFTYFGSNANTASISGDPVVSNQAGIKI